MRILVFDDDAAVGRLAGRVATMAGLSPAMVTDAEAFARQLDADPPQAILLDLQLGPTDGVQQLRLLAQRGFAGSVVLMSGFDARVLETARALAENLGLRVADILQKPLRVADLEAVFQGLRHATGTLSLEMLRAAIAADELVLEFQPVVTRHPPALCKLEALVRWEHPVRGVIPPDQFIPLAEGDEETIDALTGWVLDAAVEAYQVLTQMGVPTPLSVNLSPRNLHDLALPDRIGERLQAGAMPPSQLCLEITETAAFQDAVRTMDILSRLRLKGISLSIDDFGTGYSSFKLLRQMPFTEIKIDRSFIADVNRSRDSRMIVKSIADLAANMELGCVAEGVEAEDAAETLEQLGITSMQGFLIGRPMPIEAIPAWLSAWRNGEGAADPAKDPNGGTPAEAKPAEPAATLSPRQLDVMRLLSQGCSVKEIARRLDISIGTVKVHLSMAYAALGAHNRVEAINRAGLRP